MRSHCVCLLRAAARLYTSSARSPPFSMTSYVTVCSTRNVIAKKNKKPKFLRLKISRRRLSKRCDRCGNMLNRLHLVRLLQEMGHYSHDGLKLQVQMSDEATRNPIVLPRMIINMSYANADWCYSDRAAIHFECNWNAIHCVSPHLLIHQRIKEDNHGELIAFWWLPKVFSLALTDRKTAQHHHSIGWYHSIRRTIKIDSAIWYATMRSLTWTKQNMHFVIKFVSCVLKCVASQRDCG